MRKSATAKNHQSHKLGIFLGNYSDSGKPKPVVIPPIMLAQALLAPPIPRESFFPPAMGHDAFGLRIQRGQDRVRQADHHPRRLSRVCFFPGRYPERPHSPRLKARALLPIVGAA